MFCTCWCWLVGDVAFSSITYERTEQTECAAVEILYVPCISEGSLSSDYLNQCLFHP